MFHIRRVRCFANGRTEPLTGRPEPCRDTCAAGASAGPPADTSARTPPNPPAPAGRCCAAAPRRCTRRWGTRRWGSPSARDEAEPALRERGGGVPIILAGNAVLVLSHKTWAVFVNMRIRAFRQRSAHVMVLCLFRTVDNCYFDGTATPFQWRNTQIVSIGDTF